MTTADRALIISLGSFVVAFASFIWTVWSKFIYPKARIRVHTDIMRVFYPDGRTSKPFVVFSATNFGPTDVTIHAAIARKRPNVPFFTKNATVGFLNPLSDPSGEDQESGFGPFSGGHLPKKLAVGESLDVKFPISKNWILKEDLKRFGFVDGFGRKHWNSSRNARVLREKILAHNED